MANEAKAEPAYTFDPDNAAECETCRNKPGTPSLCAACVHNRMLVIRLKNKIKGTAHRVKLARELIDLEHDGAALDVLGGIDW